MSARINILSADETAIKTIEDHFQLPRFIATVLVARGVDTIEKATSFLNASIDKDWHNPYEIEGMEAVVSQLEQAVKDHKRILVFGDFDLDGISATTIMARGLREVGGDVVPFIPLRFEEGYGLTEAAIARALTYEPDVVITVDNGISAKEEAHFLTDAGVSLIVTDHHEPSGLVPQNVALVDPKCSDSPSSILAGAGVSLKVIQALCSRFGMPHFWRELIDFATLGTVADLMPMVGENRALVSEGIKIINDNPRACLAALLNESGFGDTALSSSNLSFTIVPRLNAAGRMGNAQLALDLLMCDDFLEASTLARELEATNTMRRSIESELTDLALKKAEETYNNERVLIVSGEGWHEGVKGIVASRLASRYGVPSILFTIDGEEARGSGRSVGEINLFKAVESCQDLLTRFGGHEAAVGVTLPVNNLPVFFGRLCEYMDKLPSEEFSPRITVDAGVNLSELTKENVEKIELLAPFGQENKIPRFLAHSVTLAYSRAVGADKNHLSCTFSDGKSSLEGIMFHCSTIKELQACPSVIDAVFELQIDVWRGRRNVKAIVSSLVPVAACSALAACSCQEDQDFLQGLFHDDEAGALASEEEQGPNLTGDVSADVTCKERKAWNELAYNDPVSLRRAILRAFIGEGTLHQAQIELLTALDAGVSTLGIMGTGRGKSLVFQTFAVELALKNHRASLFVYPLRALISDQAFHLKESVRKFGIEVEVLTGDTSRDNRLNVMTRLSEGLVDIVLTTPEYLEAHLDEFVAVDAFSFLVVDEAHHVALSKAGFRASYPNLGLAREALGNPLTLALTATADEHIAQDIQSILGISSCIYDDTARENLTIDDHRGLKHRLRYLVNIAASGEKTIVYVNSRLESIAIARDLRKQLPQIAWMIGFYNAGLSREERERVEELFRTGELQVLIATSAFGEGINIPNVRHVVLYHLPFSEVEFNQMSGRAGRDGEDATVHLLFAKNDSVLNESILNDLTPNHDDMAQIYRQLRGIQRSQKDYFVSISYEEVAQQATKLFPSFTITASQVKCGVTVFSELGLIEVQKTSEEELGCAIHVVDYKGKVELFDSARYREGMEEIEIFKSFSSWVFKNTKMQLQQRIQRPLLPFE